MFSRGTSPWITWAGEKMWPPPFPSIAFKERHSSRTSSGVPNGRVRWVLRPPQNVSRSP